MHAGMIDTGGHGEDEQMVTFDSPVLMCKCCGEVVLRDTKWQDCARAHGCQRQQCPYHDSFLEKDEDEENKRTDPNS